MTLRFTLANMTTRPIELEGLTPDSVRDKSPGEIERFEVLHGNQRVPLAELFRVEGDPSDEIWELHGDLARVHGIGAQMRSGRIRVDGPVGRYVGAEMRGGEILVEGDAGDSLGSEMKGGSIRVRGKAGNFVGAALCGSARGTTGGTILVDGNVGDEAGAAMRRGLIAVGGNAGNLVGYNMLAGTVLVVGDCGRHAGAGMRRGTLGLLGAIAPALPATFRFACTSRPTVLPLVLRELQRIGFKPRVASQAYDIYNGDFLAQGRGEIFVRHSA